MNPTYPDVRNYIESRIQEYLGHYVGAQMTDQNIRGIRVFLNGLLVELGRLGILSNQRDHGWDVVVDPADRSLRVRPRAFTDAAREEWTRVFGKTSV